MLWFCYQKFRQKGIQSWSMRTTFLNVFMTCGEFLTICRVPTETQTSSKVKGKGLFTKNDLEGLTIDLSTCRFQGLEYDLWLDELDVLLRQVWRVRSCESMRQSGRLVVEAGWLDISWCYGSVEGCQFQRAGSMVDNTMALNRLSKRGTKGK